MLKDLEERGASSTSSDVGIATNLSAHHLSPANKSESHLLSTNHTKLSLIKMGGVMALVAGAAYLWTQNTQAESEISIRANIAIPTSSSTMNQSINQTTDTVANNTDAKTATSVDKPLVSTEVEIVNEPASIQGPPLFETVLKFNTAQLLDETAKQQTKLARLETKRDSLNDVVPTKKNDSQALGQVPTATTQEATKPIQLAHVEKPVMKQNANQSAIGKQINPQQQSANQYMQALTYLQQGRVAEAQAMLVIALEANPANHEARQTLAGLLLDNKRQDEAKLTLAEGVIIAPEQTDFRMALARLLVESGDLAGALNTLETGTSHARNNGNYQVFLATLLQRANRHDEAIAHYNSALSLNSASGQATASALVGLGISLQATDKLKESQEVFTRAQSSTNLSPELLAFVEQRIKQIQQRLQN